MRKILFAMVIVGLAILSKGVASVKADCGDPGFACPLPWQCAEPVIVDQTDNTLTGYVNCGNPDDGAPTVFRVTIERTTQKDGEPMDETWTWYLFGGHNVYTPIIIQ